MLAEKPSIVIPHVLDQFLWANKVYELNVGMKPIKSKELNEKTLVATIELLKANYNQMTDKVHTLSEKMKEEKGLQTAVTKIQKVCDRL